MKRHKAFILLLMFYVTSLLPACKFSKGERARAMEQELQEKIKTGVLANTSKADVEAFVDRLSVAGERPVRQEYSKDFSGFDRGSSAPHKPKEMPPNIVGHVIAKWASVESDITIMHNVGIYAIFFFDADNHLVTYSVHRYFTN